MVAQKKRRRGERKSRTPETVGLPKRTFRFATGEAETGVMRYKGKLRLVRVPHFTGIERGKSAELAFLRYRIFHALFPEHSITPVAVVRLGNAEYKRWGLVSEILKGRSRDYKIFHKWQYTRWMGKRRTFREWLACRRHEKFAEKIGKPLAEKLRKETGISVASEGVNICNVAGTPVFFELGHIDTQKLENYIESHVPDKRKRRTLLRTVEKYEETFSR